MGMTQDGRNAKVILSHNNVARGGDISRPELARLVASLTVFEGRIISLPIFTIKDRLLLGRPCLSALRLLDAVPSADL